jgi:hypothetical protein
MAARVKEQVSPAAETKELHVGRSGRTSVLHAGPNGHGERLVRESRTAEVTSAYKS